MLLNIVYCHYNIPRVEASIASFGLTHLTVGSTDSKSIVLAVGSFSELYKIIHNDPLLQILFYHLLSSSRG